MCQALVGNTICIEFDASNNPIDNKSLDDLVMLITKNKTIRKFYLEDTFINDYSSIMEAMEGNRTIIDMTLGKFASEEELDDLDAILDRNEKK